MKEGEVEKMKSQIFFVDGKGKTRPATRVFEENEQKLAEAWLDSLNKDSGFNHSLKKLPG